MKKYIISAIILLVFCILFSCNSTPKSENGDFVFEFDSKTKCATLTAYTGEDKKVYVSLKKESEESFRFSVRDTGKGIDKAEISNIWDRYYRAKEVHQRPIQGTGLGLSIVKAILEKHKFYFGVDSEMGKGSTFYVLFPLLEENP